MNLKEAIGAVLVAASVAALLGWAWVTYSGYPARTLADTKAYGRIIEDDRGPVLKKAMEDIDRHQIHIERHAGAQ